MIPVEEKIAALRAARARLATGWPSGRPSYPGICSALSVAARHQPRLAAAAEYLKDYIARALGHHAYLESYVAEATGLTRADVWGDHRRMLATRLAWIGWMIACYQEQLPKTT